MTGLLDNSPTNQLSQSSCRMVNLRTSYMRLQRFQEATVEDV